MGFRLNRRMTRNFAEPWQPLSPKNAGHLLGLPATIEAPIRANGPSLPIWPSPIHYKDERRGKARF